MRAVPNRTGPIAVVAPGTGLGEAFLIWGGSEYVAGSSEGGHADFAPAERDAGRRCGNTMSARFGHVSYERVCSGSGIPNIYDFLRDAGRAVERPVLAGQLAKTADRTPLIVQAGTGGAADPLAPRPSTCSPPSSARKRAIWR